jgi:phenylalanine-4-hydroxylase
VKKPKIYGAGLLSSIGEALLHDRSSKRKFHDISAAQQSFDITKLQPIYVTLRFLFKFGLNKMALRTGGVK